MLIRVMKDFVDKDSQELMSSSDTMLKKVSEARGHELVCKGYAIECTLSKSKRAEE